MTTEKKVWEKIVARNFGLKFRVFEIYPIFVFDDIAHDVDMLYAQLKQIEITQLSILCFWIQF